MNNNISVDNNQSGIYRITNKLNGKFYIGSTSNMRKRMREHMSNLRRGIHVNDHLQHAFDKYGEENFAFEVYEYVKNIDDLLTVEQRVLDDLKPYDDEVGYNISEYAYSYRVFGEDNPHYGVPKSEEHKRKIRESLLGHKHSEETKRKISKAVKGKNTGKDHWSYGKERTKKHRERFSASMKGKFAGSKNPSARKVVQLTKEGSFVKVFETMKDAQASTGAHPANITNCCKGKRKTTGGYKWMYLEEYENMKTKSL